LAIGKYRLQVTASSISPDLTEYLVEIQQAGNNRSVNIIGQANQGPIPALRAGITRIGGSEHIELLWLAGKPSGASYVLKYGGEVWRSYSGDRYFAQRGMTLSDGNYLLEVRGSGSSEPAQYSLSLYTDNGERRVSLTPVS
jgi:hypothetical protein